MNKNNFFSISTGKIILICFFGLVPFFQAGATVQVDPQYVSISKSGSTVKQPLLWYSQNGYTDSIAGDGIAEITDALGLGTSTRRTAVNFSIPYLETSIDSESALKKLLDVSLEKSVPVLVSLNGNNWWETRSDLWNWWDPGQPGYDPNNVNNVEWTGWTSASAMKIAWYNWGVQFRVKPPPNLASPAYIQAKKAALSRLLPIIVEWYRNLPEDKKYLLAGVELEGELVIGGAYYYPNGNSYLAGDPANDPPAQSSNFNRLDMGFVQQGYNALKTYGIRTSGTITADDIGEAINRHASMLAQTALDAGLPFDKIFVHGFGNPDPNILTDNFHYSSVMTKFGRGDWSFYYTGGDPSGAPALPSALVNNYHNTPWGAGEWQSPGTNSSSSWSTSLQNMLNYKSNKFVNFMVWEEARGGKKTYAVNGISDALQISPSCWLSPPNISSGVSGSSATLNWEAAPNTNALHLNVSASSENNLDGTLKNPDKVSNQDVTGQTTTTLTSLQPGIYYWQIVADGCSSSQKRINSGTFAISSPVGFLDGIDCTNIGGWAGDPDNPNQPIDVSIYVDGPKGYGQLIGSPTADDQRESGVCEAIGGSNCGVCPTNQPQCEHGYHYAVPSDFLDEKIHNVYVYGSNLGGTGGSERLLTDAPKTFKCIKADQVATPTDSPGEVIYSTAQAVTLATTTSGADIHYTTDGSDPTNSVTRVRYASPFFVASENRSVRAVATKSGMIDSNILYKKYIIQTPDAKIFAPTAEPSSGTFSATQSVVLSPYDDFGTAKDNPDIYYTLDGTTPTAGSTRYTGPITISSNKTLKAVAIKSPTYTNSDIITETYLVNTADITPPAAPTGLSAN